MKYRLNPLSGYVLTAVMALSLLIAQSVGAQQEITVSNDFSVGTRATGMGEAFISVADDFTALHWNPAGLSRIKKMEFFMGLSHEKLNTEVKYFDGEASTFASNTKPNSFGIVIPIPVYRGGLAFAFGVNRVQSFDFRTASKGYNKLSVDEDPEFGDLFIDQVTDESGGIYEWSLGGAVDVAPGVSVGAALNLLSGNYRYELGLDAIDTNDLDILYKFVYRDVIDTDYFGIEGKIGVMARIMKVLGLGATVSIPLGLTADEYWSQDSYYYYDDESQDESYFDDGVFGYDISRPFRFSGGASLHPIPGTALAMSATYTDWTQTQYSEPPSEDISNEDFKNDYRDTLKLSVGGEVMIPGSGLRLRAGYMRDPLPYTPEGTVIDTERQFIGGGIGVLIGGILSLDVTYMHGFWKESKEDGTISKDRKSNRIMVSAAYRF